MEKYEPSRLRLFAARLHCAMTRGGDHFERISDAAGLIAGWFIVLVGVALAGFVWIPLTGTLFDLLLWFAAPLVVTIVVEALARRLRRRRFGSKAPAKTRTAYEAMLVAFGGWFGLLMSALLVANLIEGEDVSGAFVFFVLVGALTLGLCVVDLHRYVTRE